MQLSITEATIEDIPALVQLVNSAYRGAHSRTGWTTEADLLQGIRTDASTLLLELQAPGACMLKATDATGNIKACVYLQQQETELYLGMLTVSPVLQNKGIGKLLLQKGEERAKSLHCAVVSMTVISARTELINWYQRQGYAPTGETKPFIEGVHIGIPQFPLEFLVLKKQL